MKIEMRQEDVTNMRQEMDRIARAVGFVASEDTRILASRMDLGDIDLNTAMVIDPNGVTDVDWSN